MIKYYDIGLNLFCKQFREPEKIINDAMNENVSCILTGSDMKSSESVNANGSDQLLNPGVSKNPEGKPWN